jgi:hypothetical protein
VKIRSDLRRAVKADNMKNTSPAGNSGPCPGVPGPVEP